MNHEEMMIEQAIKNNQFMGRSNQRDPGIDPTNFGAEELQAELDFFKDLPAPVGYQVMLRMFKAPSQTKSGLIASINNVSDQDFHEYIGLVIKLSDIAYTLPRYNGCKPWVQVGQWMLIPRAHANVTYYKGRPVAYIKEDVFLGPCNVTDIEHFSEK